MVEAVLADGARWDAELRPVDVRVRLMLDRMYMSAILHVEAVTRGCTGELATWCRGASGELLHWSLDELATL